MKSIKFKKVKYYIHHETDQYYLISREKDGSKLFKIDKSEL